MKKRTGHGSSHGGTPRLDVVLSVKFKVVNDKHEFYVPDEIYGREYLYNAFVEGRFAFEYYAILITDVCV